MNSIFGIKNTEFITGFKKNDQTSAWWATTAFKLFQRPSFTTTTNDFIHNGEGRGRKAVNYLSVNSRRCERRPLI